MSTDLLFELDTSGEPSRRSSRLFYTTIGSLEKADGDASSKPSQERPAILKTKTKRYHEQDDSKRFKPGILSHNLRDALGLRALDIPDHIYRMRHLGYPPGWLKKAEVKSEGITIFGANNNVINANQNQRVKYDWEKLHEYPGFNSYNSYDHRYDYCREKGFLPMQEDCLLQNFRNFLWRSQMLGKEATDISQIRSSNSARTSGSDFNLPPNSVKRQHSTNQHPSQLENKRIKYQSQELSDGEIPDEEMDVSLNTSIQKSDFVTEDGTVLIVPQVVEKPSLDRFSEGINEHRLFENLPNAGGTYQKVKDVLRKVRL